LNKPIGVATKYKERIFVFSIFICIFISRLALLLQTDDFHGLSAGKVLIIDHFLRNPFVLKDAYFSVHPPGHLLFLFIGLKFFYSPLLVPRFVSLFFGSMLVFPFYYYIRSIFNVKIAAFSLLALAVYSQHIIYSVLATQDITFQFFLFFSFLMLLSYYKTQNQKLLFFSAVTLGFAGLCRYEGVAFFPLFSLFVGKKNFRKGLIFFASTALLPVCWFFVNYKFGDNSNFFDLSSCFGSGVPMQFNWIRSQGFRIDFIEKLSYWPLVLVKTLGIVMPSLGLAGIIFCLKEKKNIFLASAFLLLFFMFILKTIGEQIYFQPRYSISLGLMLIPFSFYGFFKIFNLLKMNTRISSILAFVLLATMIPSIGRNILSEPLFAPRFAKNIASYLKENINEGDRILVDHCGDEKYKEPIKLLSRVNPKQFVFAVVRVEQDGRWVADKDKLLAVLEAHSVTCLLYSPQGDFASVLELENENGTIIRDGFVFEKAYEYGPYQVYWVKKDPEKSNKVQNKARD